MRALTLPACDQLSGEITIPGSKSISNRALLLAALAEGTTRIVNLLDSDDVRLMRSALQQLGVELDGSAEVCQVTGKAGPLDTGGRRLKLDLGLAGTAIRPLTAALTLGNGRYVLDGIERMR